MKKFVLALATAAAVLVLTACNFTDAQKEAVECQKNPQRQGCPVVSP